MNQETILDLKNQGNSKFQKGEYDQAIKSYEQCILELENSYFKQETDDFYKSTKSIVLTNSAICYLKQQLFKKCKELAKEALDTNPLHQKARYIMCKGMLQDHFLQSEKENIGKEVLKLLKEGKQMKLNSESSDKEILELVFPDRKVQIDIMMQILKNEDIVFISEEFILEVGRELSSYNSKSFVEKGGEQIIENLKKYQNINEKIKDLLLLFDKKVQKFNREKNGKVNRSVLQCRKGIPPHLFDNKIVDYERVKQIYYKLNDESVLKNEFTKLSEMEREVIALSFEVADLLKQQEESKENPSKYPAAGSSLNEWLGTGHDEYEIPQLGQSNIEFIKQLHFELKFPIIVIVCEMTQGYYGEKMQSLMEKLQIENE